MQLSVYRTQVSRIHAARIVYPRESTVHHTLLSPVKHVRHLAFVQRLSFCARGSRKNCRGDVSPADACDKSRNLESLTAGVCMWILEDWQDGKGEPHIRLTTKQERCWLAEKA